MRELNIGIVAEGKTDRELLNSIVCEVLGKENNCKFLCPNDTFETTGWPGVWSFCQNEISTIGFERYLKEYKPALDAIVFQLDGDTTFFDELYCSIRNHLCSKPYPDHPLDCYFYRKNQSEYINCEPIERRRLNRLPISNRAAFIVGKLKEWCAINVNDCPTGMLFAIPFDAAETWILAALGYENIKGANIEELRMPYEYICENAIFHGFQTYQGKDRLFKNFIPTIMDKWNDVTRICPQASLFHKSLKALIDELCPNPCGDPSTLL